MQRPSRVMLGELGGIGVGGLRIEGVSDRDQSNPTPFFPF